MSKHHENILEEADRLTGGDRNEDYGHPLDNHSRTAAYWSTYLGVPISPEQVCVLNVLQKIARSQNTDKRDNWVDVCGWTRNIEMIQDERKARAA